MESTINVALARQMAVKDQMSVMANNIANMSTGGYKAERLLFKRFVAHTVGGEGINFVGKVSLHRDSRNGPITRTSNQLDIALKGHGFLTVQTPQGIRYSRNGHLGLNDKGELISSAGHQVLDRGQRPIVINDTTQNITIAKDGTITADGNAVGRINVVKFDNIQALKRNGGSFFRSDVQPVPDDSTEVLQGHVEGSNVQPVLEMTQFMSAARFYQTVNKMIEREDERMRRAIEELGATPQ
jgi:flagellar basal-body rod protein FlgF